MALQYYNARASITQTPSNDWKDDLQQLIDFEFENSSDVYDIEEELIFGTQIFTTTRVKVNHVLSSNPSGTKLGDDYRAFLFQDFTHAKGLGYRYRFNNNIWLCMNSDLYKFVTASTTVRRCNNQLKWKDQYGVIRQEPCVIDYAYSGTQVDFDQAINIPSGSLVVVVQYNQYTSNIQINDRFIFGKQAFKVKSMNDFFQNQTGQQNTTPLLYLNVYKDSIADGDDLINGIPASNIDYTISLNTAVINQSIGYTSQLVATVKRNGEVYNTPITWTSSDVGIVTVDNNGNVSLIANGNCVISAKMTENNSVIANCNVTVQAVPSNVREVRITPNVSEILQGKSVAYTVNLYVNNVLTPSTFSFVGSGASANNYTLSTVDGNHFTVMNKLKSTVPLVVTASNGVDVGVQNIILKGSF